ncbi:DUF2986 domain-containing protein [Shewanella baltica]|uniref:DUF2986 domain-containing protein n=1 Tax=Shewanella baltica TaxID=62322 RepID=UPI0028773163|nr:DUF2986 domain-containing protein [Shewanella baltica]
MSGVQVEGYNRAPLSRIRIGALMNRKKKINQTLKSKAKKANAKLQSSNKPKYIAKADREALAAEADSESHAVDAVAVNSVTLDSKSAES